jgi:hypothetical protein
MTDWCLLSKWIPSIIITFLIENEFLRLHQKYEHLYQTVQIAVGGRDA